MLATNVAYFAFWRGYFISNPTLLISSFVFHQNYFGRSSNALKSKVIYIDYYMLRASLRASELYGIKNEWIKTIWLLTWNNLFITCYMLALHLERFSCRVLVFVLSEMRNTFIGDIHKSWRGHFVDKSAKQFFLPNLTPGARRQLK